MHWEENYYRPTKPNKNNKKRKSIKLFNSLSKIAGYTEKCSCCHLHFKYLAKIDNGDHLCVNCFLIS